MNKLWTEIFRACDNRRVADATEERLLAAAEAERERLRGMLSEDLLARGEALARLEARAQGYVERAYFYEGFRAAMRLMRECGIEPGSGT